MSEVRVVISGSGLSHPKDVVSNEELIGAFNEYVRKFNEKHAVDIAEGKVTALSPSDPEFVVKASGIKSRYSRDKANMINPDVMFEFVEEGSDEDVWIQAQEGLVAADQAFKEAHQSPENVDAVIVSCTHKQRDYPSIAVEIQNQLGIKGFGFDMGAACSSASFGIQVAVDSIKAGRAKAVLMVTPELSASKTNLCDRDSHFIFGEATTALLIERADQCKSKTAFEVIDTHIMTSFSNNIRNNSGAHDRSSPSTFNSPKKFFYQEGRKVFKEVTPMVVQLITEQLAKHGLKPTDVKRYWLHQANINMNRIIAERLLGDEYTPERAPVVLDEFANTAGAGSAIAFHRHHQSGMTSGDYGVLCSFGAGYSIGFILMRKM